MYIIMKTTLDTIKKEIQSKPGISRRELTDSTGLDIRTVSAAVRTLLKQGFISARRDKRKSVGRTGDVYFPADEKELCFAGFYLEMSCIMCTFKDADGKVIENSREPFFMEWASLNHTAKRLHRIINDFEKKNGKKVNAAAITFRERRGPQFAEGVRQLLAVYTGLPVYEGTPIDAFAWTARMKNPDAKRIVMMHFGMFLIEISSINELSQAPDADRFAKELSHTTVEKKGPPCYCGKRGCLEYYVHGFSMNEELRERKNIDPAEVINLSEYYRNGDPDATEIVRNAEKHMLWSLKKTAEKFQPDIFFLLLLNSDSIVRTMDGIVSGSWVPPGMNFQLYDIKTNCSDAIADKAILLSKNPKQEQI